VIEPTFTQPIRLTDPALAARPMALLHGTEAPVLEKWAGTRRRRSVRT
jgi:hypothetical protein